MSVYFATCREADAVKIGSSVDPHGRLPEIQAGCPLTVTLEAVLPGGIEEEFAFHERFSDVRIRREWFRITPMIEAIIAANPPPPPPAVVEGTIPKRTITPFIDAKAKAPAPVMSRLTRYDHRLAKRELSKRVSSGDIHFPFRKQERESC